MHFLKLYSLSSSNLASVTAHSGLLVSTEISVKNKFLLANITNKWSDIVMNVDVVHKVTDLLELGSAPVILADEGLLFAVRTFVDLHQFVVLFETLN